ncbi:TniQ family protein [Aestuariirhabdus litorea]|nr:TniQ family protein [Aestuariirhabdus litorea]
MSINIYPFPYEGQSINCYVRRLAEVNGYPSVGLFKEIWWKSRNISAHELCDDDIAEVIGYRRGHLQKLRLLSSARGSWEHHYGAMLIPSHHLHKHEMYCPACFKEKGYMLAKWSIGWLPLCLEHQCPLIPVDYEAEKLMPPGVEASRTTRDRRQYDLFGYDEVCKMQAVLEARLAKEERGNFSGPSLISCIDTAMMLSTGAPSIEAVKSRRRRYPMRYFPFWGEQSLQFVECLSQELKAA